MPVIRIPRLKRELVVEPGYDLFSSIRAADLPLASSCQGEGICGRCVVTIVEGAENLTEPGAAEQHLSNRFGWRQGSDKPQRAACCACLMQGEITLETPYW